MLLTFLFISVYNVLGVTFILCVAKLVPVGYGIKKLQIGCVVEDEKVSLIFMTLAFCVLKPFSLGLFASSGGN